MVIALAVFAAFMHLFAYPIVKDYAQVARAPNKTALVAITGMLALSWSLMASQAMESVTRAFYARSDLDLILSSPAAARTLFSVRVATMALATALTILFATSAARVEAAQPPPDLTPQQIEAAIEDAFAGLVSFDVPRVINHFAADAVLEDPVGTPPMVGTQAITAYLQTFPTLFNQMKLYSLDIKVGGQEAAVTWRLRFTTKTGKTFFLEGIGHFKFNSEGKIQHEKEFFDLAYFLEQLQG